MPLNEKIPNEKKSTRTRQGLGGRQITVEKEKVKSEVPFAGQMYGTKHKTKKRTVKNTNTGTVKSTEREKLVQDMSTGGKRRISEKTKSKKYKTGEERSRTVTRANGVKYVQVQKDETEPKPYRMLGLKRK